MPARPPNARMTMLMRVATLVAATLPLAGCASYYAVETTPEGILTAVSSGDTVRIRTRENEDLTLLVWRLDRAEVRGRLVGGDSEDEIRAVRYDRIAAIDVRRLNLRKAMLTTFVPVMIGAIIFCSNEECDTQSGVSAGF